MKYFNIMKRNIYILLISGLFLVSTNACNREGCTDTAANNYDKKAKTNDGSCTYDNAGYVGTWTAADSTQIETASPKIYNRSVTISADPSNKTRIIISRIKDNLNVGATISGNAITLEDQTSSGIPDAIASGSGIRNGNNVRIVYSAGFSGKGIINLTR